MNAFLRVDSEREWQKGYYEDLTIDPNGVSLNQGRGCYIGAIIDTEEYEHMWSRLHVKRRYRVETKLIFYTVAVEQLIIQDGKELLDLEKVILEHQIKPFDLIQKLKVLNPKRHENLNDILLNDHKGRYLIYWFELISEGESDYIEGLEIHYEPYSWINYLPQIYAENKDFLERYLAIFQTVFDDLEGIVDSMPEVYIPRKTKASFLNTLNEWLPIDSFQYFTEAQKRDLLSNYHELNHKRGTKEGLIQLVTIFTGSTPFVVEFKDYKHLNTQKSLYQRLYMNHPFGFTLLIPSELITNKAKFNALNQIIRNYIPAQVTYKIAPINTYMILDDYAYLGINSYIYHQTDIKLDDNSMLSMGVIGHE